MGSCASSPIQTSTDRLVGHCLSADEKARLASWEAWLDVFQSVSTCEVAAVKQFAAYLTAQRFENPDDLLASHDKVESELKTRGFARDGIARMFLKAAAWSDSLEILPDLCGIISPLGASPPAVISHTHDDILYPRYITASSGLIFISDGRQIHCLRTTGASLHSFPIQEAYRTSSKSAGLCFAKGLLYVSAHPSSQILVFRTDGTLVSKWEVPFQPWGIAYGDGLFFVSDAACSQVHILTCDGQLLRSFGPGYDYDRKSFVASPGITFSQHHVFVIFDQEVSMYRTDGSFVRHIVSKEHTNSDQPINPWDLAVCGDRVLVTDSEGSIFIYSLDGGFINYLDFSVKSHGYSAVVAKGVCASAGSVFVVDRGISMTRRIRAIPESTVLSVAPVADE